MKCSKCGCEGIHACMGDISKPNPLDEKSALRYYNRINDAIERIRKSEAERKNGGNNRSS